MLTLFIILICAHSLGDFLLQTKEMVAKKKSWWVLLAHSVVHGTLAYVLLQQWWSWEVPVVVAVLHGGTDFVKSCGRGSAKAFAWDQATHVFSQWVIAFASISFGWCEPFAGQGWFWILSLAGFVAVVFGVGYYVSALADELVAANPELAKTIKAGLQGGGKQIGRLERAMIFAFILAGEPAGIGFLVAAKSILRFEEAKQQPVAEYVIIGTLWSFGLAMVLAWLTRQGISLGSAF